MEENNYTPPPINLNCWKHHAGFIKEQIKQIKSKDEIEKLKSNLVKIGESQMDLYLGKYLPEEISNQTISILKRKKIFSSELYRKWLSEDGKDYQLVKLKDKSVWVLRFGKNHERYIHIHPARYSPHTIRVKANTLKTAILILSFEQIDKEEIINTETVNNIRKKYLNEPPLKLFSKASGLLKLIDLFRSRD